MTNQELFRIVREETYIPKEVTDILLELDVTTSVTSQASLDELLNTLYQRLEDEDIDIEVIGDKVTQAEFKDWVYENYDEYSADMFFEDI
ncbi:MAG: hypothetical protein K6A69_08650 [Lachnospiraceae bacterium]|nr:hypothetical protein [Lachnospiraceae bacterium]